MFAFARSWKRYSLPSRLAGSPVHDSARPSTAKEIPDLRNSRAIAWVVERTNIVNAPAHPTQNRYSTSSWDLVDDDCDLEAEPLRPVEAVL